MNVDIAERLAKRRREAGYSQESLAEKLGVSRQAVSKWERSESSPDTDNLIALAQLYGVSLDDLLYVDETLQDDVDFEAADKAAGRKAEESARYSGVSEGSSGESAPTEQSASADTSSSADQAASSASDVPGGERAPESVDDRKKVNIGFDGIHVKDGEDYVHVSWRDGVHVKDSKEGDEVHVGWDGVHVTEGKKKGDWSRTQNDRGDTVSWESGAVIINGREYDSWHDAHEVFARNRSKAKTWNKFPFPLVAIIAYILLGVFTNEWAVSLFVFFTIPLYYMLGYLISRKRVAVFFEALYPFAATVWFLWMAFVFNAWHPAWVIFLTIPLVEWLIHSISRAYKRNKKEDDIIDVEPEDSETKVESRGIPYK